MLSQSTELIIILDDVDEYVKRIAKPCAVNVSTCRNQFEMKQK